MSSQQTGESWLRVCGVKAKLGSCIRQTVSARIAPERAIWNNAQAASAKVGAAEEARAAASDPWE